MIHRLFLLISSCCFTLCAQHPETEGRCSYLFDTYPSFYLPPSAHWLAGVSVLGDSLELNDGSIWKVSRYDEYKVLGWRSNDPLIITQNHRWFSNYQYRIINQATGSTLETNLFLGPLQYGEHTFYVHGIDYCQGSLILTNAFGDMSYWEISDFDLDPFQDWSPSDPVIIGQNSGWDAERNALLINVAIDNFVRARQF